jgi:hypothetical protein
MHINNIKHIELREENKRKREIIHWNSIRQMELWRDVKREMHWNNIKQIELHKEILINMYTHKMKHM